MKKLSLLDKKEMERSMVMNGEPNPNPNSHRCTTRLSISSPLPVPITLTLALLNSNPSFHVLPIPNHTYITISRQLYLNIYNQRIGRLRLENAAMFDELQKKCELCEVIRILTIIPTLILILIITRAMRGNPKPNLKCNRKPSPLALSRTQIPTRTLILTLAGADQTPQGGRKDSGRGEKGGSAIK